MAISLNIWVLYLKIYFIHYNSTIDMAERFKLSVISDAKALIIHTSDFKAEMSVWVCVRACMCMHFCFFKDQTFQLFSCVCPYVRLAKVILFFCFVWLIFMYVRVLIKSCGWNNFVCLFSAIDFCIIFASAV